MPKDAKVTKTEIATGDVYKRFGQIALAARVARPESGELPIVYVKNRDDRVVGILPASVVEWIEENADAVLAAMAAGKKAPDS